MHLLSSSRSRGSGRGPPSMHAPQTSCRPPRLQTRHPHPQRPTTGAAAHVPSALHASPLPQGGWDGRPLPRGGPGWGPPPPPQGGWDESPPPEGRRDGSPLPPGGPGWEPPRVRWLAQPGLDFQFSACREKALPSGWVSCSAGSPFSGDSSVTPSHWLRAEVLG